MIDPHYRESPSGAFVKWVTVARLRQLLAELPENALVVPNDVHNLALYRGEVPYQDGYFGAINVGSETWEPA